MIKKILLFRTDRIGDLLFTCPTILTLKNHVNDCKLILVTSEKNYKYAKSFRFIDEVLLFPKRGLLNKFRFLINLYKLKFDRIFIFDGKDRSIITSIFLRSKNKVAKIVNRKQAFFCKLFKIKFSYDLLGKDLNDLHEKLLNYSGIDKQISNFQFLKHKDDNGFSSKIPLDNYIQVHLDEKWFSSTYIKSYKDISPSYEEFSNFIKILSDKKNVLITTGLEKNNIIEQLELNSTSQPSKNVFINNIKENIVIVNNLTLLDIESVLRKTKTIITCHGGVTQAAASLNVKIIDIVEQSKEDLCKRYSLYIKNYYSVYRDKFSIIKNRILQLI